MFESTCDKNVVELKAFWTIAGSEDIFLLNISDDYYGLVSKFFQKFLENEIKVGKTGSYMMLN